MSKLKAIGIGLFISLLFIPTVLADYPENFDSYPSGTPSPGIWTLGTAGTSACTTGTEVMNLVGGTPPALSAPNSYIFSGASTMTCSGTTESTTSSATLAGNFNATGSTLSTITLSFFYYPKTALSSNSTIWAFTVSVCGSALTNLVALGNSHASWHYVSDTVTVTNSCSISLALSSLNTGTHAGVLVYIDNLYVKGANAVTPGANFFIVNAPTGAWFGISNYSDSYVRVDFPSGPPIFYYNVTVPDLVVNTVGASLVTVWIGQSFFVSIIPAQSGSNYVYVYAPSSPVLTYNLAIQDLSGVFNPGTQVYVYQGNRVMFSGYSDAQNAMAVWLVSGNYRVMLKAGTNVFDTNSSFPSISGSTVAVQILKETFSNSCASTCTISYAAGFNPTQNHVIVIFNDSSDLTVTVTDALWIRNTSGTFQLYSASHTGTFGTLEDSISCSTKVCNVANASEMYVQLNYNGASGSDSVNLALSGGGLFRFTFSLPQNLLGWDVSFPSGSTTPTAFLGYILVIAVASIFGVFSARFGVIVTSIFAAALMYAGFIPVAPGAISLIIGIAVMSFIASLERS